VANLKRVEEGQNESDGANQQYFVPIADKKIIIFF
jgi:hypothetical protein